MTATRQAERSFGTQAIREDGVLELWLRRSLRQQFENLASDQLPADWIEMIARSDDSGWRRA